MPLGTSIEVTMVVFALSSGVEVVRFVRFSCHLVMQSVLGSLGSSQNLRSLSNKPKAT